MKILALDIGGSKMMAAIAVVEERETGNTCTIDEIAKTKLKPDCKQDELIEEIRNLLGELGTLGECESVGVNVPGLTDPKNGIWIFAPFSGIQNVPIAQIVGEMSGCRSVAIENDVNACALAEKLFGICREVNDFLWITISNGIGGGLVLGGEIYRGHFGNAGEIGHFNMVEEGELCGCGNRGCLEAEAAGPAIARRFMQVKNTLFELGAVEIADLARRGDPDGIAVFDTTGFFLGKAAAYAANLINPEKIVIGGGVSGAFDLLEPKMNEAFSRFAFQAANKSVSIEKTALGYEAALVGAAAVGYKNISKPRP